MARRNPKARWVLPDVIDPPRTCYTIQVPNNAMHKAAFRGALLNLASALNWQDDPDHTAREVALVWREIYDLVMVCKPPEVNTESWDEDLTSLCEALRFENGHLQALCCGKWVDIDGQSNQGIGGPGQPGGGSPQPTPGGGSACYDGQLAASGTWLLPTLVSTGDNVELSEAKGAGNDGVTALWRCPDGQQFFAGACVGYPVLDGGDPLPGAPRMRLVWNIDGTYYDAMAGALTVPGGVSNAQVTLQVNDDVLAGNSGTYSFKACVTNNAVGSWEHTWNLTLEPGPFHIVSGFGEWVSGIGWRGTDAGSSDSLLLLRQNDSSEITSFDTVVQVTTLGGTSTTYAIKHDDPAVTIVTTTLVSGSNPLSTGPIAVTDSMLVDVYNNPGTSSSFSLISIHATGPGAFPY